MNVCIIVWYIYIYIYIYNLTILFDSLATSKSFENELKFFNISSANWKATLGLSLLLVLLLCICVWVCMHLYVYIWKHLSLSLYIYIYICTYKWINLVLLLVIEVIESCNLMTICLAKFRTDSLSSSTSIRTVSTVLMCLISYMVVTHCNDVTRLRGSEEILDFIITLLMRCNDDGDDDDDDDSVYAMRNAPIAPSSRGAISYTYTYEHMYA